MRPEAVKAVVEALLFVSDKPVTLDRFKDLLDGVERAEIREAIAALQQEYDARDGGLQVVEVAGGYQMASRPQWAPWVRRFQQARAIRLSRPALETLAMVAYRQPVCRPDIEHIRGVDCGGTLKTLLERRLIRIVGRMEGAGRPLLYGTTREFLQHFGLKALSDLPNIKELQELAEGESLELPFGRETEPPEEMQAGQAESEPGAAEAAPGRGEDDSPQ